MNITVIGTGYVGLVSGVCYAEMGNQVICVDKDPYIIDELNAGGIPIFEPGLEHLVVSNKEEGRLSFTTDVTGAVRRSDIVIIAVGTPQLPNGEANLAYIYQAAQEIAEAMDCHKIIVIKSTVPVGTNEQIAGLISAHTHHSFDSVSIPEFLREGTAVQDTMFPDRIIIGTESGRAAEVMIRLHDPLGGNILVTDLRSAEMIKYASNAFLATKISFINEIANICEELGADVKRVAEGMGYDKRIGTAFLNAGIGYGGSCFPKDTGALIQIADKVNYDFKLLRSVVKVNQDQRLRLVHKLDKIFNNHLEGRTIGIWGLSFKPNTDDVRDSPAVEVIRELLDRGAEVRAYDPVALSGFQDLYGIDGVIWCSEALSAAEDADALCLLTEWDEFVSVDLMKLEATMRYPILVDGRNVFTEDQLQGTQFSYHPVGRPMINKGIQQMKPVFASRQIPGRKEIRDENCFSGQ